MRTELWWNATRASFRLSKAALFRRLLDEGTERQPSMFNHDFAV
jgi:hypothetical protein